MQQCQSVFRPAVKVRHRAYCTYCTQSTKSTYFTQSTKNIAFFTMSKSHTQHIAHRAKRTLHCQNHTQRIIHIAHIARISQRAQRTSHFAQSQSHHIEYCTLSTNNIVPCTAQRQSHTHRILHILPKEHCPLYNVKVTIQNIAHRAQITLHFAISTMSKSHKKTLCCGQICSKRGALTATTPLSFLLYLCVCICNVFVSELYLYF